MRLIPVIAAALILFCSCPSFAQGWIEYASQQDFFTINFPGEPEVQDSTYDTAYFITLPARVYSHENAPAATRSLWSIMGTPQRDTQRSS